MIFDLIANQANPLLVSILCILAAWGLWTVRSSSRQRYQTETLSYPPYAPGRLPVVGHLPYLAQRTTVQELFRRWSLEAGPVFTVQMGTKRWVILNSMEAVNNLIVGRSAVYSSRNISETLVNFVFNGVDHGGGFAFFPYGKQWRYLRRVAHGILIPKRIDQYQPILNERRCMLLQNIWEAVLQQESTKKKQAAPGTGAEGIQLTHYIEHFTITSILAIAFGDMCNFPLGDVKLQEAFLLTERTAALLGLGEQLRDFFPILRSILPSTLAEFINVRDTGQAFYNDLLREFKARQQQQHGNEGADDGCCFVKEVLANGDLSDRQIVDFMLLLIGAGSETTASTIEWMVALLANHPEVQDKVYREIKEHVGLDRLPGPDDEPHLPYLQCVILETLRLCPPAPLSVPHATSEDDVYQNWLIPAGTTIVMNLHAIHQDPLLYPEPHRFLPERHLAYVTERQQQRSATFSQTIKDRPHLAFSTGRRVCVGIHLAERNVFLAASGLMSCFRFERETDALIQVSEPRNIRSPTFAPPLYRVKIAPRHERIQALFSASA